MKAIRKFALAATVILLSQSCKKEGPAGPAGANGKDGNANVTTTMLNVTSWTWDGAQFWRYVNFTGVTNLSAMVNSSGAVMLYAPNGTGGWQAVPYSVNITSTVQQHCFFEYNTDNVKIYLEMSDFSDPNPPAVTFKLVCIPPAGMALHPDVDLKNYEEVARTFNIK